MIIAVRLLPPVARQMQLAMSRIAYALGNTTRRRDRGVSNGSKAVAKRQLCDCWSSLFGKMCMIKHQVPKTWR